MSKPTVKIILLTYLITGLVILGIDKLLGMTTAWNVAGNLPIVESSLAFPASINSFLEEIWFVQGLTFVIAPIILFVYYRRWDIRFIPLILVGCLMAAGLWFRIRYDNPFVIRWDMWSWIFHRGPVFYPPYYDNIDTSLQSAFPYFVRAQIPILITFVAGIAIYLVFNRRSQHGRIDN